MLRALITDVLKLEGDAAVINLNRQKQPLHYFDYFLKMDWEVHAAVDGDKSYRTADELIEAASLDNEQKAPASVAKNRVIGGTVKIREFSSEEIPADGQWPLLVKVKRRYKGDHAEEPKFKQLEQLCEELRERLFHEVQKTLFAWLEEYRDYWAPGSLQSESLRACRMMLTKTVVRDIVAGGVSTAAVSAVLNPIDVVKTRRQVGIPRTALQEVRAAYRQHGAWQGLWRPGLTASLLRELLYSGCTKGLYPLARDLVSPRDSEPHLGHRVAAAAATGLGGSLCANGPDVVKVRLFAEPGRYPGFFSAATEIARNEGFVRGLLVRGVSASAPRGAAIAIGEVTTYDQTKTTLRRHWPGVESAARDGRREPFSLHVATSLITGVVATTVAAPFDTLKSCVMADDGTRFPRGFPDALMSIIHSEGPASLFRGWWPAYCRLGPHAILTFPLLEQVRKALGLQYF
eukprot:s815_g8.t1